MSRMSLLLRDVWRIDQAVQTDISCLSKCIWWADILSLVSTPDLKRVGVTLRLATGVNRSREFDEDIKDVVRWISW